MPDRNSRPAKKVSPGNTAAWLTAASEALVAVSRFEQAADACLAQFFRARPALGPAARDFIRESVFLVLRRQRFLQRCLGEEADARQWLLAAWWLCRGERPAPAFLQAGGIGLSEAERRWLAALDAQPRPVLSLAEQAELPDWLAERWRAGRTDEEFLALARGFAQPAPLDLRVNALRARREAVLRQLRAEGFSGAVGRYSPWCIRLDGKPALQRHPLYLDGTIEIQDEGSQLIALLLGARRGERVADYCAGAGGKTLALAAQMRNRGQLHAFDVAAARLRHLKERAARAGVSIVSAIAVSGADDARLQRLAGKLDRVLVDAPCSGLGTLRRNPEQKWRQTPHSVAAHAAWQADILCAAARLLRPGGRLVYATCSLLAEENEDVVADFLASHGEFRLLDAAAELARQGVTGEFGETLRLWPHRQGCDGFFAALLERRPDPGT